jgi:hypothetical protein
MKRYANPLAALPFAALLLACVVLLAACKKEEQAVMPPPVPRPAKANNLKYVDCNRHIAGSAGTVEIAVHPAAGIALEDDMVFVCAGERVHWKAAADTDPQGNTVQSFTITFPGNQWPFKPPQQVFTAGGQASTPDQEVADLPANSRPTPFKYKIVVTKSNGDTFTIDPHVIPMGS